jgi:metacaspase-1
MKKALLIELNAYANVTSLYGCVNDVEDVAALLMEVGGLAGANIRRLLDDKATRQSIMEAIGALVAGTQAGDHIYVHYSGHGAQIPSADPNEPDLADEVLCPYDFDWSSERAIKDDDLRHLLAGLPNGASLTFTADSCHGGDFARAVTHGILRTPTPPAAIVAQLASRSRTRRLRSGEFGQNGTIVSACRSWETAKDGSFDGRAAGVFTHYFVAAVRATPTAMLDQLLTQFATPLSSYEMHPVAEGSVNARSQPYATTDTRGQSPSKLAPVARRLATLWEHCWSIEVFGHRGDTCVAIALSGGDLIANMRTHLFGGGEWNVTLTSNATFSLDLAFGVKLRASVRDWSLGGGMLRFYLSLDIVSAFFSAISIGAAPVAISLEPAGRSVALDQPRSAAEFLALVNLNLSATATERRGIAPPTNGARAPGDIVTMSWGDEGWGPNWREERAVRPAQQARAVKRTGVNFDPVRGGGWVEFRGWLTPDDERDPGFIMHIGNGFFGGWGSVHYTVEGIYEIDDPFPLRSPSVGLLVTPAPK